MPDLVYNVKFNIDTPRVGVGVSRIGEQAEAIGQSFARSTVLVDQFGNTVETAGSRASTAMGKVVASSNRVRTSQKQLVDENKRMNSSFSSTNQVLFSFSDGVQDASQFSYGFASGMRAIGNNIGFTAELMANLRTKVNEYNLANQAAIASGRTMAKTMRSEVMGALKGPGGIILGINLAITAVTVLTREMEKYKKRAEEASAVNKDLVKSTNSVEIVFKNYANRIAELEKALKDAKGENVDDLQKSYQNLGSQLSNTNELISLLTESQKKDGQELLDLQIRRNELVNQGTSSARVLTEEERNKRSEELKSVLQQEETVKRRMGVDKELLANAKERRRELNTQQRLLNLQSIVVQRVNDVELDGLEDRAEALRKLLDIEKAIKENREIAQITEERISSERERRVREMIDRASAERAAINQAREELMRLILNPPSMEDVDESPFIKRAMQTQEIMLQLQTREAATRSKTVADIELEYARRLEQERYKLLAQGITDRAVLDQLEITNEAEKNAAIEQMNRIRLNNEFDLAQQAVAGVSALLRAGFNDNKAVAIAETLISTYFAAQKAYASQMTLTPDSPIRAKLAAAAAIASGLARVAMIRKTQIGGTGGGSQSEQGFQRAEVVTGFSSSSARESSYMPVSSQFGSMPPQAQINLTVDETGFALYMQNIEGKLQSDTMAITSA